MQAFKSLLAFFRKPQADVAAVRQPMELAADRLSQVGGGLPRVGGLGGSSLTTEDTTLVSDPLPRVS